MSDKFVRAGQSKEIIRDDALTKRQLRKRLKKLEEQRLDDLDEAKRVFESGEREVRVCARPTLRTFAAAASCSDRGCFRR